MKWPRDLPPPDHDLQSHFRPPPTSDDEGARRIPQRHHHARVAGSRRARAAHATRGDDGNDDDDNDEDDNDDDDARRAHARGCVVQRASVVAPPPRRLVCALVQEPASRLARSSPSRRLSVSRITSHITLTRRSPRVVGATSAIASASAFFHASRAASSGADILSRPCGPSIVKMKLCPRLCLCRPRPHDTKEGRRCVRDRVGERSGVSTTTNAERSLASRRRGASMGAA